MRGDDAVARVAGRTKAEELATRQERLTSAWAERANAICVRRPRLALAP